MRIVHGPLKHHRIHQPKVRDLRPIAFSVRSQILKILGEHLRGARVLDLFAGSGSLGLDALSGGAAEAVFVDFHESCASKIRESLKELNLVGRGRVYREAVEKYLTRLPNQSFDIIFFTPPYRNLHLYLLPQLHRAIKNDGYLVAEHPTSINPEIIVEKDGVFHLSHKIGSGWSRAAIFKVQHVQTD